MGSKLYRHDFVVVFLGDNLYDMSKPFFFLLFLVFFFFFFVFVFFFFFFFVFLGKYSKMSSAI